MPQNRRQRWQKFEQISDEGIAEIFFEMLVTSRAKHEGHIWSIDLVSSCFMLYTSLGRVYDLKKSRRSARFHCPPKYFFPRSWDLVQEDAAAPAKPLLLHRALLLGRVDLHDHRLPWRLPHHVSSRQVREKYRVFVLCCHLLSTMFVKRQYFPQRKANEKMILEGDGPSRQLKCKLEWHYKRSPGNPPALPSTPPLPLLSSAAEKCSVRLTSFSFASDLIT